MSGDWIAGRRDEIAARLARDGFTTVREDDETIVYHNRKFSPSRFGMLDSVVTVQTMTGTAAKSDLVDHEEAAVREALELKVALPRGLFSAVEVFPVTLVDEVASDAIEFVCGTLRNRWAVMSMSAVVHNAGTEVATYEGRKVWGGAYVTGLRTRVLGWVG